MFIYPSATVKTFLIMDGNHVATFWAPIAIILKKNKLMNTFFLNNFQIINHTHPISFAILFI